MELLQFWFNTYVVALGFNFQHLALDVRKGKLHNYRTSNVIDIPKPCDL